MATEHFVTGVGMDGVIETIIRTLVEPGEKVAVSTPTFSFYALAAMGQGAEVITVPREADFSVDTKKLVRAAKEAKVTVLCSPNNPSGNATGIDDVREVLEGIEGPALPRQCLCGVLGNRLSPADEEAREPCPWPDLLEGPLPCRPPDRIRLYPAVAAAMVPAGRYPVYG